MDTVKILAIAPYEGLRDVILEVADRKKEIEVDAFVADLQAGADIVKNIKNKEMYDVIISRGGTAELIRQNTDIPIIEIQISIYDILRGIKMAETFAKRFVIVGFRSFTNSATILCNLMQYNTEIHTISNAEELQNYLPDVQKKYGKDMVLLCDNISNYYAQRMGITSILITSGTESIETAFHEAVQISKNNQSNKALLYCLKQAFDTQARKLLIYKADKAEVFDSGLEKEEKKWIQKIIQEYFFYPKEEQNIEQSFNHKGYLYEITRKVIHYNNDDYYNFYIKRQKNNLLPKDGAITILNYQDVQKSKKNAFHNYISFTGKLADSLSQYAKIADPIVLIGESGTGKDNGAKLLYEQGLFSKHPLYIIDCEKMTNKHWKFLLSHENSPFYHLEYTIYVKNINLSSSYGINYLLSFLEEQRNIQKNKLIFSFVLDGRPETQELIHIFTSRLYFSSVYFPALRERIEQIPLLASLYINELNTILGKQVIGFDDNAIELIKKYEWDHNFGQFKRIIKELVITTQTPYITYETVYETLKKENFYFKKMEEGAYAIKLDKSLKEIELEIVQTILKEENGNQSKVAKRLGISRGTLWRMLKNS